MQYGYQVGSLVCRQQQLTVYLSVSAFEVSVSGLRS